MRRATTAPSGGAFGHGRAQVTAAIVEELKPARPAPLPSAKLKPACGDPFAKASSAATPFSAAYASGAIPARIHHSAVKHTLLWTRPPSELPFDPLLLQCAEGLRETVHPHIFVARNAFGELLTSAGAAAKAAPLLPRLVAPLRLALASADTGVVVASLTAFRQLAVCCGEGLVPVLKDLLVQVAKHEKHKTSAVRDAVRDALAAVEDHCGTAGQAVMRAKLPTWGRG